MAQRPPSTNNKVRQNFRITHLAVSPHYIVGFTARVRLSRPTVAAYCRDRLPGTIENFYNELRMFGSHASPGIMSSESPTSAHRLRTTNIIVTGRLLPCKATRHAHRFRS